MKTASVVPVIALLVVLGFLQVPLYGQPLQEEPLHVRVGIVAYEDFSIEFHKWEEILSQWQRKSDPPLRFDLALGTHSELLHWINNKWIDMAVLPPGLFAQTLDDPSSEFEEDSGYVYLSTSGYPSATSDFAKPDRRGPGPHFTFRPVCVVSKDSKLRTADDLKQAARQERVRYLLVHPFSTSGGLAPLHALKQIDASPSIDQIEFTYSHSESLHFVSGDQADPEYVAFVWDDAFRTVSADVADSLRSLEFPQLSELVMPTDAILVKRDHKALQLIKTLLGEQRTSEGRSAFVDLKDWKTQYARIRRWADESTVTRLPWQRRKLSMDEIGWVLLQHAKTQPRPLRLGLVLAGGGAKCSYQVGAVKAVERKLAQLRQQYPQYREALDLHLVVGTSGGAINAIPVALGVSKSSEGQADFAEVWKGIDQREVISPPRLNQALLGIWFGLVELLILVGLIRWLVRSQILRGWILCGTFTMLGLAQIILEYFPLSPWSALGENHIWHHLWLVLSFGSRESAWFVLALGLFGLGVQFLLRRRGYEGIPLLSRHASRGLLLLSIGLPFLIAFVLFFFQETLSRGDGIERSLAKGYRNLLINQVQREGSKPLSLAQGIGVKQTLRTLSQEIFQQKLLERDLVVTSTCLVQSKEMLPSDLYLYMPRDSSSPKPAFGTRGFDIRRRPELLLDVVIGSGSVFPLFPPRRINDFPLKDEYVELIDGGFSHNSPTEAAVLWGATHIIVIEASPKGRGYRGNFAENVAAAIDQLQRQTQQVDMRSKRNVRVFTLAPQPPHICLLDFADNLIEASIEQGYQDASGETKARPGRVKHRWFEEELGRPIFVEIQ